ncbi:olfactory receptor 6C4-like [Pseudophryne corroboree]|uniref:olfactory receptor 6C4-like n=1 Tax=Pseudophryne corroboree TaxID=495146 RepID=UPI0030816B40
MALKEKNAMIEDLGRLEDSQECGNYSLMPKKLKIMHLGLKNPKDKDSFNGTILETTEEKDLGVTISGDLKAAFDEFHQVQNLLVFVFLQTYIISLMGNITIIFLVKVEPSLHTVMYFFISVFSFLEIMLVSVIIPKLLAILISENNVISFIECFTQMYMFISFGATECYLLVAMVFDRHLAINNPLHYPVIMTPIFCYKLVILPWIMGFATISVPVIMTACLEFCGPNVIDHFFCDLAPLQNLACSDSFVSSILTSTVAISNGALTFSTIIGFYIHIIMTVSKIKSEEGKQKAFSTCSSHLIVAGLFYGTGTVVYVKPKGSYYDKYLTFMYTALTPMINPFIYTFRNRDVRNVLRKSVNQIIKPASL